MDPDASSRSEQSDEKLMCAYGQGDAAAFDRLYEKHKGGIYRYMLRHTENRALADELHQDVWLRVVKARAGYETTARFRTWLYTLARNRLVDHWRSNSGQQFVTLDDENRPVPVDQSAAAPLTNSPDPVAVAQDMQLGTRLRQALAMLPAAQSDAFLLHVEGGLPISEIADIVRTRPETVKSRLRYAYARLRTALGDCND